MNDRRRTAIHEAGHAVVGRILTMLCGGASIRPDEEAGEAGHAITADPYAVTAAWEQREKWRNFGTVWTGRILTVMAGAEAEIEILGSSEGGDGDDRYQITLMLHESLDETGHEHREARLRRFARQIVRRHRNDIERVAAALEVHETLAGEEIDALLPPTFMSRPVSWDLALPDGDAEPIVLRQPT